VEVTVTGPDHNREYTVEAFVGRESFGLGSGASKQAATQAAAQASLRKVGRA
jgi:ribonuclease-3